MKHISNMSLKELLALDAALHKQIEVSKVDEVKKLQNAFKRVAAERGLTQEDFLISGPITKVHVPSTLTPRRPKVINLASVAKRLKTARWKGITAKRTPAKRATPKKKIAAKYKNKATGETWTGRGRMANWLAAEVKKGKSLKSFQV